MTTFRLRPIGPADQTFLYEVYASTRLEELAPLGWNAEQQTTFLTQQFHAQHQYYQATYVGGVFQIILVNDQPTGRLYVVDALDHIRVIDIALLPAYRRAGIGSRVLTDLLSSARQAGKPVRLHVQKCNRALRLYERLGFAAIADTGVSWLMEWS